VDIEAISLEQAVDLFDAIERREAGEGLKTIGCMAAAISLCFAGKKNETPPIIQELERIAEGRLAPEATSAIDIQAARDRMRELYPHLKIG